MASSHSNNVIACDIGGVVKDNTTDQPVDDAIESVMKLSKDPSKTFIFISKCNDKYMQKSTTWLKDQGLAHIPVYYCLEWDEKVKLAHDHHVRVMIDDRMQVLKNFPASIVKIWFCSDKKKIEGARRYQPDFADSVRLARTWPEVVQIVEETFAE